MPFSLGSLSKRSASGSPGAADQLVQPAAGGADPQVAGCVLGDCVMSGGERYSAELEALRATGVRIVVDDFGTGYSSLSYLKHLPIDTIKIDRSFIANVHTSPKDEAIVHAILSMARSLGLEVVAEGVESHHQLAVLEQHGCEMAQGYYFGRPMPAKKCAVLMRELARRPSFTDTVRLRLCGTSDADARASVAAKRSSIADRPRALRRRDAGFPVCALLGDAPFRASSGPLRAHK